jgi:HD-like signal output (HDOD) protein
MLDRGEDSLSGYTDEPRDYERWTHRFQDLPAHPASAPLRSLESRKAPASFPATLPRRWSLPITRRTQGVPSTSPVIWAMIQAFARIAHPTTRDAKTRQRTLPSLASRGQISPSCRSRCAVYYSLPGWGGEDNASAMSIQGNFRSLSASDAFVLLHQLRKTGILTVVTREHERGFLFAEGNLVYATSQHVSKRLGSYLIKLGFVTRRRLEDIFGSTFGRESQLGKRLVEKGIIDSEQLRQALTAQIIDIVEEVLGWEDGAFHFDEAELPFHVETSELISTQSVLFDCSRKSDESALAKKLFIDERNLVRRVRPMIQREGLSEVAIELLDLIDGDRSVGEILMSSEHDFAEAARSLSELIERGIVEEKQGAPESPGLKLPKFDTLPVSPDVASQLFAVLNARESGRNLAASLEEIISKDPLLTAKILKVLAIGNVTVCRADLSVRRMIDLLGSFHIRTSFLPEATRAFFFPTRDWYRNQLWLHSHLAALFARKLAAHCGFPHPEEAYVAALLHNLGAFLLYWHAPSEYSQILYQSVRDQKDIDRLEEERFGVGHTKLGSMYAEKWGFPTAMNIVMKVHHQPLGGAVQSTLLDFLHVANGALAAQAVRVGFHECLEDASSAALRRLGIDSRTADDLMRDVRRGSDAAAGSLVAPTAQRRDRASRPTRVLGR